MNNPYPFLNKDFLEAMNDISRHGFEKHGDNSVEGMVRKGNLHRATERHQTAAIQAHVAEHFASYVSGEMHDYFHTSLHQLAAVAINAMIEAEHARLVDITPKDLIILDRENDPEMK